MLKKRLSRRLAMSGAAAVAAGAAVFPFLRGAGSTPLNYPFSGPAEDRAAGLAPPAACTPGTLSQTEGPYYTPRTPRRADLREAGTRAETLVLEGLIVTPDCNPIAGAVIDIWHCDENGRYDNIGFRYRGHQYADAAGAYRFTTIRPRAYRGRTQHIHVKAQGPSTRLLTTQVYFPDQTAANARDSIFREELLMRLRRDGDAWRGRFDLVLTPA